MMEELLRYLDTMLGVFRDHLPGLAILIPTATAFALPLIALGTGRRRVWEIIAFLSMIFVALANLYMFAYVYVYNERIVYCFGGWPAPIGIVFEIDAFSALLGTLVSILMLFIALYSFSYMDYEPRLYTYYTLLLAIEAGMLGCLYTADFFNLFVMVEVVCIAAYALVAYERSRRIAIEAAIRYAIYGALATTVYLIGIAFAYGSLGTLNMGDMTAKLVGLPFPITGKGFGAINVALPIFAICILWAFTFKAAIFPNHFWLPWAHAEAPTPISALLSGLVVKIGLYVLARFLYTVFGGVGDLRNYIAMALLAMGIASAYVGALSMVVEKDVKRLIAYSTVLNVGMITVALAIGIYTRLALYIALYYIVSHAIAKALAFMSAGLAIKETGSRYLEELEGFGRVSIGTGTLFAISMLCLGGVPPMCIFMAKLWLYVAIAQVLGIALAIALAIPSIIAFTAYARAMYMLCVKPPKKVFTKPSWKPIAVLVPLAIACIFLGLAMPIAMNKVISPAVEALIDYGSYIEALKP